MLGPYEFGTHTQCFGPYEFGTHTQCFGPYNVDSTRGSSAPTILIAHEGA